MMSMRTSSAVTFIKTVANLQPLSFSRVLSTIITQMPSKRKQRHGRRRAYALASPLEQFFANYPAFHYDATESASHEFYRLCDEMAIITEWDCDFDKEDAHQEFKNALVRQFNDMYGTDEDDLGAWQSLCHVVDIDPVPDDLESCREIISGTHVNLVDLVDSGAGRDVQVFDTERELSEYTRNAGKYFPKQNAYAGGLLRYLLRHIVSPSDETVTHHRGMRRRR